MSLAGMIAGTLIWGLSLVLAMGCWFATIMMTDAGGRDSVEDVLVMFLIVIASAYFLVVVGSLITAWVTYLMDKPNTAQFFMLLPLLNILIYFVVFILLGVRQPSWRLW